MESYLEQKTFVEGEEDSNLQLRCLQLNIVASEVMKTSSEHWYADYAEYLGKGILPTDLTHQQRKSFFSQLKSYTWEDPFLFKECKDRIIRKCVVDHCKKDILRYAHHMTADDHNGWVRTSSRVLQSGYYWPTLYEDARAFVNECEKCQNNENCTRRIIKPFGMAYEVDVFDVWEMSIIGPFVLSGEYRYILIAVDYVSKWAEIMPMKDKDFLKVTRFVLKRIVRRYGTPRLIVSDESMDDCTVQIDGLLRNYGGTTSAVVNVLQQG